jgi:hypothetical protein
VSYGCTAVFTIVIVVILAALSAQHAGRTVKEQTSSLFDKQVHEGLGQSKLQTSNLFTQKFQTLRGSAALLSEIIRDRIVGYPDNFADDQNVPFVDSETGRNAYPIKGDPLPRDFEVVPNLTPENIVENTQERANVLRRYENVLSTISASFFFQGNCDPNQTNPNGPAYLQNCTAANNDPLLGGIPHPTPTLAGLSEKANDLGIFLKPLWEAEPTVMQISVYFFNSGAGAVLSFPSFHAEFKSDYMSSGCDWMREINPYTGRPFGGDDEMNIFEPSPI